MGSSSHKIRDINDRFRAGDTSEPGQVLVTTGVQSLVDGSKSVDLASVLEAVARYDCFDVDNDPYHEHDFGCFDIQGERLFWKIDLYEEPNVNRPNEASTVTRVLTIMLASEY